MSALGNVKELTLEYLDNVTDITALKMVEHLSISDCKQLVEIQTGYFRNINMVNV